MHIACKLLYFYIDSNKQLCNIENVSRVLEIFWKVLNSNVLKFLLFSWIATTTSKKKIELKIFLSRSQESLEKKIMDTHCNALLVSQ